MAQAMLEQRVSTLEDLMAEFLRASARTQAQLERTQAEVERTSREMREFKDESRESRIEMNRRWGELANKMGTMAEDLVVPSIPRILRTVIGCPDDAIDSVAVRMRRRHPATRQLQEFDVVAACGEYVLINETKSSLDPDAVTQFVDLLSRAGEFFPEYAGKKIIGAIASLYVDASLVRFGEKQGLIVLGFGEDVMEVLNSPEFAPKEF